MLSSYLTTKNKIKTLYEENNKQKTDIILLENKQGQNKKNIDINNRTNTLFNSLENLGDTNWVDLEINNRGIDGSTVESNYPVFYKNWEIKFKNLDYYRLCYFHYDILLKASVDDNFYLPDSRFYRKTFCWQTEDQSQKSDKTFHAGIWLKNGSATTTLSYPQFQAKLLLYYVGNQLR